MAQCPICKKFNILWLRTFSNNSCHICYEESTLYESDFCIGVLTCGHEICKTCSNYLNIPAINQEQIEKMIKISNFKCPCIGRIIISPPMISYEYPVYGLCEYCNCRVAQSWVRQNGNELWYRCCMIPR